MAFSHQKIKIIQIKKLKNLPKNNKIIFRGISCSAIKILVYFILSFIIFNWFIIGYFLEVSTLANRFLNWAWFTGFLKFAHFESSLLIACNKPEVQGEKKSNLLIKIISPRLLRSVIRHLKTVASSMQS